MGALWGFPWKQRAQVGLHDLPVEWQLQVTSAPERERKRDNDTVGLRLVVNKYLVSRGHFNYVNVPNTEASG